MTKILLLLILDFVLLIITLKNFLSFSTYNEFLPPNNKKIIMLYRFFSVILFIITLIYGIISMSTKANYTILVMIFVCIHCLSLVIVYLSFYIFEKRTYLKILDKHISYYLEEEKNLAGAELITYIVRSLAVNYNLMYRHSEIKKSIEKYESKGTKKT